MPWCHRSRKSTTGGEAKFAGGPIDSVESQVSRPRLYGRMLKAALGNAPSCRVALIPKFSLDSARPKGIHFGVTLFTHARPESSFVSR